MYNRYVRNDQGVYTRIPEEELSDNQPSGRHQGHPDPHQPEPRTSTSSGHQARPEPSEGTHWPNEPRQQASPSHDTHRHRPPPQGNDGFPGTLRNLLNRFHLESVDTGDLLLLLLLLLLFKEDADEELLFALGLLLIL